MKITTAASLMTVISALSFGVFATESINQEPANREHRFGTTGISRIDGASSDIHQTLGQATDALKGQRHVE